MITIFGFSGSPPESSVAIFSVIPSRVSSTGGSDSIPACPPFFSDVFDLSYEYWGDASRADELIHRRNLARKSFSVWRLQQQRVVAVFTMNSPEDERETAPKWIEEKRVVSTAKLNC
jgi:hypothetical protein